MTAPPEPIENPWARLPAGQPFVLSEDRQALESFNRTAPPHLQLRLEHLPEPFLGRPDAPVVLLGLNPGYDERDDHWHNLPEFAARSRANMVHGPLDYPFYLLDPAHPTPGHDWWRKKLRALIERTSLMAVARNVLCVEFFPYHSLSYGHDGLRVPSQYYSFDLVRRAMARGAVLVRMRAEARWFRAVPQLASYERLRRCTSVQNPTISHRSLPDGFEEIVGLVRAHSRSGDA